MRARMCRATHLTQKDAAPETVAAPNTDWRGRRTRGAALARTTRRTRPGGRVTSPCGPRTLKLSSEGDAGHSSSHCSWCAIMCSPRPASERPAGCTMSPCRCCSWGLNAMAPPGLAAPVGWPRPASSVSPPPNIWYDEALARCRRGQQIEPLENPRSTTITIIYIVMKNYKQRFARS